MYKDPLIAKPHDYEARLQARTDQMRYELAVKRIGIRQRQRREREEEQAQLHRTQRHVEAVRELQEEQ